MVEVELLVVVVWWVRLTLLNIEQHSARDSDRPFREDFIIFLIEVVSQVL